MFREGEVSSENLEGEDDLEASAEKSPEMAVEVAVKAKEDEQETDPITSSNWVKRNKKGLMIAGGVIGGGAAAIHFLPTKFLLMPFIKFAVVPLYMFAKKILQGKTLTFADGVEIADKTFSLFGVDDKKNK